MADAIVRLVGELKSARTDESRVRAARKLREWVRVESRGGTDSNFNALMTTLNNRIFELINSPDPADKLGGIAAIFELTDEPVPDNETKIVRFANYLRVVAPSTGDPAVLRASSKALGHLARAGGTMTADFVEYEAKRALEWLQATDARAESRKLAAVLILRELADNAPTLFYPHMSSFFVHISGALTDSKLHIRENAAKALHSCLALVAARRSRSREQWFGSIYNWCRTTLQNKGGSPEFVHGALLTLGELLANTGAFLMPRFIDICEIVLKYRDHKDKLVRRTVIVLLPRLAHFHPETFVRAYAETALAHLLTCLRDPKQVAERGTAYVAVGRTALAIGSRLASDALRPQLERIVALVKDGLTPGVTAGGALGVSRGRTRPFVPEALTCVAMLARAVGPALMEYMHDIIDPMFSDGLSVMLTETLQAVADAIPALKPLLQERLLHELSLILANRPFTPPFAEPTPAFSAAGPQGAVLSATNVETEDYMSLLAPHGIVPGWNALGGPAMPDDRAAAPVGYGGTPADAYGALSASGLAPHMRDAAGRAPASQAANALAALAALISAGPPSASATPTAGPTGSGVPGMLSPSAAGLPVTVMAPTTMSWARHLPSAASGAADTPGTASGPAGASGASTSTFDSAGLVVLANARGVPNELVCLCLHTLGTFDFTGVPLLSFAREVVMAYVDSDDPAVRLEAALALCRLMVRPTDIEGSSVDPLLVNAGLDGAGDDDSTVSGESDSGSASEGEHDSDGSDSDAAEGEARRIGVERKASDGNNTAEDAGRTASMVRALREDVDGLEQAQQLYSATEAQRRRRIATATRAYLKKLRPPHHPLLVYGTDTIASTLGMGPHTSPVALALAGYTGGIADVGAQVHRLGLAHRLRRIASRRGARGADGSFLGSITAVIGTGPTLLVVTQLLQRLLVMALTDPDPAVRFEVLASLDSRFDALLVEPGNLRLLFQGLQDENFACREGFLALLGRLVAHNPAYILPAVRRTLLAVLAELEYADAHPDPAPVLPTRAAAASATTGAPTSRSSSTADGAASRLMAQGPAGGTSSAAAGTRGSVSEYNDSEAGASPAVPGTGLATSAPAAARINAYHNSMAHDVVLACASGGGGREHAARMLGLLIRSCQRLVAPYVPVILRALLPHTWAISPSRALLVGDSSQPLPMTLGYLSSSAHPDILSTCILAALGELSAVGADAMLPYMPIILPIVVDAVSQGAQALGILHVAPAASPGAPGTGVAGAFSGTAHDATTDAAMTDIDSAAVVTSAGVPGSAGLRPGQGAGLNLGAAPLLPSTMAIGDPLLFTEVAVRTLGLLIENTGQVIVPYLDHPHLLHLLLAALARPTPFAAPASVPSAKPYASIRPAGSRRDAAGTGSSTSAQWSLRREIMRTMGILGALDPYRHRMAQIAQAQRAAAAVQAAVQARLAAAIASAKARGRRIAAAGLTPAVISTGMKAGAGVPFILYDEDASGFGKDGDVDAVILNTDGTAATGPWALHAHIPPVTGVAVGAGLDIDPMEAAMAGLAGEAGANVGINLDEVGLGMGPIGAVGLGLGGDGILGAHGVAGLLPGADAFAAAAAGAPKAGAAAGSQGGAEGGAETAAGEASDGPLAAVANMPASAILPSMVANTEDFYPAVSLTALLSILGDESLALHHNNVLQAVMLILRSLGGRCVAFLPRVVPAFLSVLRSAAMKARTQSGAGGGLRQVGGGGAVAGATPAAGVDSGVPAFANMGSDGPTGNSVVADNAASLRDTVLQQLSALVGLVRHHIRPWLPAVFALLREVWPASLPSLLKLVEAAAAALGVEAKPFIGTLVPHMLSVLTHDGAKQVMSQVPAAAVFQHEASLAALVSGATAAAAAGGRLGDGVAGVSVPVAVAPSSSRLNTRHVLHTLAVLVCGGRRALWGGHRHLLDDHLDLLVPAITRLVDAGVGVFGVAAGTLEDDATLVAAVAGGPAPGATGGATAGSVGLAQSAQAGGGIMWVTAGGVPSCSSSLSAYGPVAPIVRRQAIDTLAAFCAAGVDVAAYAPRIIQALSRVLADSPGNTPQDVKRAAVDALCLLLLQLGEDYVPWIVTVRKACAQGSAAAAGAAGGGDGMAATGAAAGGPTVNASALSSAGVVGAAGGAAGESDGDRASGTAAGVAAALGAGAGGIGGTGPGSAIRHETYERLVSLLLGFGTGYGYVGDDGMALYGYGAPLPLPTNPVELAALLYDPGLLDDSGPRLASALALTNTGVAMSVSTPAFGGTVLDGIGGGAPPPGVTAGLLGAIGTDDTFGIGLSALGPAGLSLTIAGGDGVKKLPVNQETLKRAWETNARSTKEDWTEWMRRFSVELLRESPSPALRSCCALAQVYSPLAADLFNAAFVAVWAELYDEYQDSLVQALETAFNSESIPSTILQSLLNLAEFMEHDEKALPIDVRILGQLAERVGAFAKALHYKEMEFHTSPGSCIESLISINNQLEQPEAAVGILKYAQQQAHGVGQVGFRASHQSGGGSASAFLAGISGAAAGGTPEATPGGDDGLAGLGIAVDVQEGWYEKLGRWEDALDAYERKQAENPNSLSLVLGRMRCLKALGEWQRLDELARATWPRLLDNEVGRAAVAPHAARAAWALGHWGDMEEYIQSTNEYSLQGAFFRAVLSVHRLNFGDAQRYIDRARKVLAAEFAAMGNEAYSRAYRRLVTVQQLSEMEEILTYLRLSSSGNAPGATTYIRHVRNMWEARLRGCAKNVDVWNRILSVRSLVTIAGENIAEWLQFASLCRRNGRLNMSLKVLMGLGMDGGGGMASAMSRYLTGQGSIHAYTPTLGAPGAEALDARASIVPALAIPAGLLPHAGPASARPGMPEDAYNPMLLPDHPYQPYELDYRSTQNALLEATSRVGTASGAHPRVMYAYLKHLWWSGYRDAAVEQLRALTQALDEHAARRASRGAAAAATASQGAEQVSEDPSKYGCHTVLAEEEQALRVQCHLRLGQWQQALVEPAIAGYTPAPAGFGSAAPTMRGTGSEAPGSDDVSKVVRAMSTSSTSSFGPGAGPGARGQVRMPSDAYAAMVAPVLTTLRTATHDCGDPGFGHYRAWHTWALVNFAAADHHYENLKTERDRERRARANPLPASPGVSPTGQPGAPPAPSSTRAAAAPPVTSVAIAQAVTAHAVAAVKAFLRSIALGRTRLKAYVLQDLLRLLTLWFTHGETAQVRTALEAGLSSGAVSIEVWLQVIPQLIARIHVQAPATRRLLHSLLMQIGQVHPQALVYPLTVACKSASAPRRAAALSIVNVMRRRWSKLVDQAEMVSRELIRVAILWHEMWHSGLEEASRQYFGDGNVQGMLETLMPLHEMMTNPGPQTAREISFAQSFAADLARAARMLEAYRSSGRVGDLSQAWDIYYHVFRKINKMLPSMTSLELQYVSPVLLAAHDMELSVPGTYSASSSTVRIMAFSPFIDVLSSKQRPRKVTLLGSDGRQYTFLLKGHEDLRQDERVMQLFGLVNTLLANDGETSRRDLSIRRYAVTPLSHNAGVVGWVPNCDTLHALIREYRENRKVLLNIEHRLMVQMAPMYDFLTVLQKVEVFRYALDNTTGQDLYKVLWLKSASSEVWLERRTNYTRSLAVMSIVGYILGLGDRHPSNLMLDRVSGKILHIDFGDCFEVAMTRDKFPERVPFRLTRMLVNAMEVSGIEGNYRSTCEAVMRVMRQHRDSAMAMLEAFVHDPLINWRLLTGGGGNAATATVPAPTGAAGGAATGENVNPPAAPAAAEGGRKRTGTLTSPGVIAGAVRMAELDPEARPLVQRGLAFAAEAEAAALAHAVAETGFDTGANDTGTDAHTSQALARSLATSARRGDREREMMHALGPEGTAAPSEALNERAIAVTRRIAAKLTGRDFSDDDAIGRILSMGIGMSGGSHTSSDGSGTLDVAEQVQKLICTATSAEHLAVAYLGWCPFW